MKRAAAGEVGIGRSLFSRCGSAGTGDAQELSVAAKKGTNLAGEKEPVVGLRSGLRRAQKWGSGDCFLLSSRIVHPFGQRGAISLAGDLENDRPFDQPIEESHRQRAIGHVVSPFVEVDVGHQGGRALLVA